MDCFHQRAFRIPFTLTSGESTSMEQKMAFSSHRQTGREMKPPTSKNLNISFINSFLLVIIKSPYLSLLIASTGCILVIFIIGTIKDKPTTINVDEIIFITVEKPNVKIDR